MGSGTLSGSYSHGITLSAAGGTIAGGSGGSYNFNPLFVTGTIQGGTSSAIYGAGQAWTVVNSGAVVAPTYAYGIKLKAGGSIDNSATVSPGGIEIDGGAGTLTNSGATGNLFFGSGGEVTNLAGGTINAPQDVAVELFGPGTVANAGSIIASTFENGVSIEGAGFVTNSASAMVQAGDYALEIDEGGTVINAGAFIGGETGLEIDEGGALTNLSGGLIQGGSDDGVQLQNHVFSISNAGTITATGEFGDGMNWSGGGVLTNTGAITAAESAIEADTATSTITNWGR